MKTSSRALAWKLNWFRQSELEGALLLGRVASHAEGRELTHRLIRHSAEEASHAQLWAEVIAELDLPHVAIFRSYQSFYLRHSGMPASLIDVLAFTQIFERRVHQRFHAELRDPEASAPVRRALQRMIHDEKDHLAWVAAWLGSQPGATEALLRYEEIDQSVFDELLSFENRLWDLPGLGHEQTSTSELSNPCLVQ